MTLTDAAGERPKVWPLTQAQRGLWFLDRFNPDSPFYVIATGVRLRGAIDVGALRRALSDTVAHQAALRTRFVSLNGHPYQVFTAPRQVDLPLADLTAMPEADAEHAAAARCDELASQAFNLSRDDMLRAELIRVAEDHHILLFAVHHIIFDAWSTPVLLSDLAAAYSARRAGGRPGLPPLVISVGELAAQQEGRYTRNSPATAEAMGYWRKQLRGVQPVELPTDHVRPEHRRFTGATLVHDLDTGTTADIRRLAAAAGVTPFQVLLTAFTLTLARISGQSDITVGIPLAGRTGPEAGALVGFFVNTLPLRVDLDGAQTFADALARHWSPMLDLFSQQDFPFPLLVDELRPERSANRNPLFDVVFQMLPAPGADLRLGEASIEVFGGRRPAAQFDLSCDVHDLGDHLRIVFEYSDELFKTATMAAYQAMMTGILQEAVTGGARPSRPAIAPPAVQAAPSADAVTEPEWTDGGLAGLVRAHAEAHPDRPALRCGDTELSYAALDQAASELAARLLSAGVSPGDLVGLLAERSIGTAVGMLAILRCAAVYVPLDVRTPPARVGLLLGQVHCGVVLADKTTSGHPALDGRRTVLIDPAVAQDIPGAVARPPDASPASASIAAGTPAYLIFTSGSTGQPKAVMVAHGSALHLARAISAVYELTDRDRVLQMASTAVDVSIEEFFGAWWAGSCAVMHLAQTEDLDLLIRRRELTVLNLPASLWQEWTWHLTATRALVPSSVRLVVAGSERVDPGAVRVWHDGCGRGTRLLNAYGATEATVTSLVYDTAALAADAAHTANVPVGTALPGVSAYVLDAGHAPVPAGVPGELAIGGPGVALGYFGDPAATAERFIPDPFADGPGARLYCTGDRVRELPSGSLDFLGRTDTQVKIRGSRIDLAEIERTAAQVPGVSAFVADVRDIAGTGERLVGYVCPVRADAAEDLAVARVDEWRQVHDDEAFNGVAPGEDALVNASGWVSSYTLEKILHTDMRAWLDATVDSILEAPPGRVWEIGCGTGMVLFRVAPHAESYLGTDIARSALEYIEHKLPEAGLADGRVRLAAAPADDVSVLGDETFDLVILNSVVQYFPDAAYLDAILAEAWRRLRPGGRIFLGDVRDLSLLEAFHLSIARYRGCDDAVPAELAKAVHEAAGTENELCLAPSYFTNLAGRLDPSAPVSAQLRVKRGRADTEMNRFRYDVILTSAGSGANPEAWPGLIRHQGTVRADRLDEVIRSAAIQPVLLADVPDARVYADAVLAQSLDGAHRCFADVAAAVTADLPPMSHPDDIRDRAARYGLAARLAPAGGGLVNVIVAASSDLLGALIHAGAMPDPAPAPGRAANEPLRAAHHRRIVADVRAHLQTYLPAAMVPGQILVIDQIPTTISGKVDRRRLPDPVRSATATGHVTPRNAVERALAEVWTQVLGLGTCGVRDNFFEIGGDSISWLQIMSRCARAGYQFTTRDIFSHQTVEDLAAHWSGTTARAAKIAEIPPSAGLSPIQHWFFEVFDAGRNRHNQSQWYSLPGDVETGVLERALAAVLGQHEALTLSFRSAADGWRQERGTVPAQLPLTVVDLDSGPADRDEQLLTTADWAQSALDIERGPLLRLCLFRTPADEPNLLFWCIHHLVVDAVSWQFLGDDLAAALAAASGGRPVVLPPRTTNVLTWATWSDEEAQRMPGEEADYWRRASATPGFALPVTNPEASGLAAAAHVRSATVAVPQALARAGDSVLGSCLQALSRILPAWTSRPSGTVWLEYHGRPMTADSPDVSRTVGWFTALFPFLIGTDGDANGVRARLKAVPQHGVGYGRSRYLGTAPPVTDANIVVNYIPLKAGADDVLRLEPRLGTLSGPPHAQDSVIPFAAEINWYLAGDGTLTVEANLSARHLSADAADQFIDQLRAAAEEEFADRTAHPARGGDRFALLPDSAHASPAMTGVAANPDIVGGYQLTPVQRTMLYRHLIDPVGDLNYNAAVYTLLGDLNPSSFAAAWSAVAARHDILRTSLRWDGFDDPFQLVHRTAPPAPRELDWSTLGPADADAHLRDLLAAERADPPALSSGPPFRLTLIHLAADRHWLVWFDHHILLDGWSSGILIDELLRAYEDVAAGQTPLATAPAPVPYRDYVGWLRQQGTSTASRYWSAALEGFARPTPLPLNAPADGAVGSAEQFEHVDRDLDGALANDVRRLAHHERTTVGNVLNAVWAVLLHRYSDEGRVVFGVTQNGRPAALGNVAAMVGLYAHIMPLSVPVTAATTVADLLGRVTRESWQLADVAGSASLWDVHDWAGVAVGRPLFDSVVVVQNFARPDADGDGRPVRAQVTYAQTVTGYPLTLVADPDGGVVRLVWRTGCLDEPTADGLLDTVMSVLRQFVGQPDLTVGELRMTLPHREPPAPQPRPGHQLDPPRGETETRVAAVWCSVLNLPAVGRGVNLFDLGANSLSAQRLHAGLNAEFRRSIPLVDVFGFPTVAAMAARIDGRDADGRADARAERMALRRQALRPQPSSARRRADPRGRNQ